MIQLPLAFHYFAYAFNGYHSNYRYYYTVRLEKNHNHHTDTIGALKLLSPNRDVKKKFIEMFDDNISAKDAINSFTNNFKKEYGETYHTARYDGTIFPKKEWVKNLHQRYLKDKYGSGSPKDLSEKLIKEVEKINKTGKCAAISVREGDYGVNLAYMSDFMRRVSRTSFGGEIIFLDSSGTMDSTGVRIFNMISMSSCGGLLVGVLMTCSEKAEDITEALRLYQTLLDDECFGGYGKQGPIFFMTDKSDAERKSLKTIYPDAILLLCVFHMLWAVWRWVIANTGSEDRQEIYYLAKNLVYAETREKFDLKLEEMKSHSLVKKYGNFWNYFNGFWMPLKDDWAMFGRKHHQLRGQHTNNVVESSFRILKDEILHREKAYSPVQLLETIVKDFDSYYIEKILNIIGGEPNRYLLAKTKASKYKRNSYEVVKIGEFLYEVRNKVNGKNYLVNSDISHCTCPKAIYGAPCKHFQMVEEEFNITHTLHIPKTAEEKKILYHLATGKDSDNMGHFFEGLTSDSPSASSSSLKPKPCPSIREIGDRQPLQSNDHCNILSEFECQEVVQKFRSMTDEIIMKFQSNMEYFFPGLSNMVTQYEKIKTDAALQSALSCFNKFNGAGRCNAGRKKIPVQPGSIARRKF